MPTGTGTGVGTLPPPVEKQSTAEKQPVDTITIDRGIAEQLKRARFHVWLADLVGVLALWLAITLTTFIVASACEHWIAPFGIFGRTIFLSGLVGIAVYFIGWKLAPLLLRRINNVFAARVIEQHDPTLKNSVVNFLYVKDESAGSNGAMHEVIVENLRRKAASDLTRVQVDSAVDRTTMFRYAYALAGVVAFLGAYKILSPKDPFVTVARVLAPWAQIAPPCRVTIISVKPGDVELTQGEVLPVDVEIEGLRQGETARVVYSTADGRLTDQVVPLTAKAGFQFEAKLPATAADDVAQQGLQQDIVYRIEAGDAIGFTYRVKVRSVSTIDVQRVDLAYPDYTGRGRETLDRTGDVRAVEGTRVTLHARANRPIRSAEVEFFTPGTIADESGVRKPSAKIPLTVTATPGEAGESDRKSANVSFILMLQPDGKPKYDSYQLRFVSEDQQTSSEPVIHQLEVLPDMAPEVEIVRPEAGVTEVALDGSADIDVRGLDPDFGLRRINLKLLRAGKELPPVTLLDEPAGKRGPTLQPWTLKPSELGLQAGDEVRVWAVAEDNRSTPKGNSILDAKLTANPNVSQSNVKTFSIVPPQPGKEENEDKNSAQSPDRQNKNDNQKENNDSSKKPNRSDNKSKTNEEKNPSRADEKNESKKNESKSNDSKTGDSKTGDKGKSKSPNNKGGDKNKPDKSDESKSPMNKDSQDKSEESESETGDSESGQNDEQKGDEQNKDEQKGDNKKQPKDRNEKNKSKSNENDQKSGGSGGSGGENSEEEKEGEQAGKSKQQGGGSSGENSESSSEENPSNEGGENGTRSGNSSQSKPSDAQGEGDDGGNDGSGPSSKQSQGGSGGKKGKSGGERSNEAGSEEGEESDEDSTGAPERNSSGRQGSGKGKSAPKKLHDGQVIEKALEHKKKNEGSDPAQPPEGQKNSGGDSTGNESDNGTAGEKAQPKSGSQGGGKEGEPKGNDAAKSSTGSGGAGKEEQGKDEQGKGGDKTSEGGATKPKTGENAGKGSEPKEGNGRLDKSSKGTDASGGQQPKPNDSATEPEKDPNTPDKTEGAGDAGSEGSGNADQSKDKSGSGAGQKANSDRKKDPDKGGKSPEGESASGVSQSEKQSNSKGGGDTGDQSGGGGKGSGQTGKQKGNDSAGSQSAGDSGNGAANEQGRGEDSDKAGTQKEAPGKTGKSSDKAGDGSAKKSDEASKTPGEGGTDGNNAGAKSKKAADAQSKQGKGPVTGGGAPTDGNVDNSVPPPGPKGEVPEGDEANEAYAKKATDMALQHLRDQQDNPDPELLEKLGWTKDELRAFLDRWDAMKKAAERSPEAAERLEESYKSLGIRPAADKHRAAGSRSDNQRDQRDAGGRSDPPSSYADQFKAFRKGAKSSSGK